MDKSLNAVPSANRIHIGVFGRMNAGKSSLINALTGQQVSIVSAQAGTTTDVVKKAMEIHGLGPCVFLDTAGFDDATSLGSQRIKAAQRAGESTDLALVLFSGEEDLSLERQWLERFRASSIPVLPVLTKADLRTSAQNQALLEKIEKELSSLSSPEQSSSTPSYTEQASSTPSSPEQASVLLVSSNTGEGLEALLQALVFAAKALPAKRRILGELVQEGDVILMVMPQDPEAPEGRLILPQVQTLREALDRQCLTFCTQPEQLETALKKLCAAPDLIVTDSQCFDLAYEKKPEGSRLTSFSILFAAYKGDLDYYYESVKAIDRLTPSSRVLIAECCTHAPVEEDIGRVKIPAMLRKRIGEGLTVDVCAGADFPENLQSYDLIIQCGGCMFNRRHVLSRIQRAKDKKVPMTNYGITIAHIKHILEKVDLP